MTGISAGNVLSWHSPIIVTWCLHCSIGRGRRTTFTVDEPTITPTTDFTIEHLDITLTTSNANIIPVAVTVPVTLLLLLVVVVMAAVLILWRCKHHTSHHTAKEEASHTTSHTHTHTHTPSCCCHPVWGDGTSLLCLTRSGHTCTPTPPYPHKPARGGQDHIRRRRWEHTPQYNMATILLWSMEQKFMLK